MQTRILYRTEYEALKEMNEHGSWLCHLDEEGNEEGGTSISHDLLDQYAATKVLEALHRISTWFDLSHPFHDENNGAELSYMSLARELNAIEKELTDLHP